MNGRRLIVREALKQNKESITSLTQNHFLNPKEACKSTINSILLSHNVHSWLGLGGWQISLRIMSKIGKDLQKHIFTGQNRTGNW